MIELRVVESTRPTSTLWAGSRARVVPNEPVTAEQLRRDGRAGPAAAARGARRGRSPAAASPASPTSAAGRSAPPACSSVPAAGRRDGARPGARRRTGARSDATGVNAFVDAADERAIAFARGLRPRARSTTSSSSVAGVGAGAAHRRPRGHRARLARRPARGAAAGGLDRSRSRATRTCRSRGRSRTGSTTWLREEATRPDGSFVALEDGGDRRLRRADRARERPGDRRARPHRRAARPAAARDRAVRSSRRSSTGPSRAGVLELVTWTQKGNEGMQALNRSLGYRNGRRCSRCRGRCPEPLDVRPPPPLR